MKDWLTTAPLPMERAQGSCGTWNARSAIGTGVSLWNSPQGYWNARSAIGTRLGASGTPAGGLVKNHYYTRATHGIVEVMWSNRGAFVEKLSLAMPSLTNATAKLLLFFDMAMDCPGLRALLVRIACNQAPGYRGYLGYPTCVFF